MFQDLKDN